MEIILIKDVKGKGKKGDVIKVKDGYGLNFLVKNGFGIVANQENMHSLKLENNKKEREENERIKEAKQVKEILEKTKITFKVKTGEKEQVFGQISTKQIVTELEKKGIKIDKKKIELESPIASLGTHNIKILLHKQVEATLKIELTR